MGTKVQRSHQKPEASQCVTASFGVTSIIPTESQTPDILLSQVDRALNYAKNEGCVRIVKV